METGLIHTVSVAKRLPLRCRFCGQARDRVMHAMAQMGLQREAGGPRPKPSSREAM